MDGKKLIIEQLGKKLSEATSKLKHISQETFSDWLIHGSLYLDAFINLKSSSTSPNPAGSIFSSTSQSSNPEGITLIWYDQLLETTDDTKKTAQELREVNNYVLFYSDLLSCVDYIKSVTNEKIFLITSGKSASDILREIHALSQVDSIFIFCMKVERYQDLLHDYEKVIGIYCDRSILIHAIQQNAELLQKQLNTFSFYNEHQEKATRDLSEDSAAFLWFQLFKDVILRMPRDVIAKQQLVQYCRQYYRGNQKEMSNIDEFERLYSSDRSIYWYTRPTFLYKLVNKALRTEDIEQLHIFRFFIADLSLRLAEIHQEIRKHEKRITLYRGLKMDIGEFNLLKQREGNLISTNGFFSTSRSKDVAVEFATRPTKRTDVLPVLYEIECNVNEVESMVFADISKFSVYEQEKEVLFDLSSTFQIQSINEDTALNLHVIKIQATDAGIQTTKKYIELNKRDHEETSLTILFGKLLVQMGKYDQALKYFRHLLTDPSIENDVARVYNEMGSACMFKLELNEAYEYFQRAYRMMMNSKPRHVKDAARPLTNLASVFLQKGDYEKALDFYLQALEIRQKFYGRDDLHTAVSLNNIGNVYYKRENYFQALKYHQTALRIRQHKLLNGHLDIAASFNNIGLVYWKTGDLGCARYYCEKALEIRRRLLPADHIDITQSLINIAQVFYDQNQLDDALRYYSEALIIQKVEFDPNDRNDLIMRIRRHRERQSCGGGCVQPEYSTQFRSAGLPQIHQEPGLLWPEHTIQLANEEITHRSVDEASPICEIIQALMDKTERQHALYLWQRKLHKYADFKEDDSYVQSLMWIMGETITDFYLRHTNSDEVIRFYEKAIFLLENSVPKIVDTENIFIFCFDRLGSIHQQNENFQLALDYFTRELKLQQQLNPSTDSVALTFRNIGEIHLNLGDSHSALTSFNNALEIFQSNSYTEEVALTLKRIDAAK